MAFKPWGEPYLLTQRKAVWSQLTWQDVSRSEGGAPSLFTCYLTEGGGAVETEGIKTAELEVISGLHSLGLWKFSGNPEVPQCLCHVPQNSNAQSNLSSYFMVQTNETPRKVTSLASVSALGLGEIFMEKNIRECLQKTTRVGKEKNCIT
jgi:hypothetical protein